MAATLVPADVPGLSPVGDSPARPGVLRRFLRNRSAVAGLIVLVAFVLLCFVGPLLYQTDQTHTDLTQVNLPPSAAHPLGTDALGFDQLGRLMAGGRLSLVIGLAAGLLATVIGTFWGTVAGYAGGWVDAVMMRLVDTAIAIPALFVLLVISAIAQPGPVGLVVILGLVSWLVPARLLRAETLTLKERDYVQTLRAIGGTHRRAITHHIVPNSISTIVVAVTLQIADSILLLAYVSYLGMGVRSPDVDWGGMLSDALSSVHSGYWWLTVPPGLCVIAVVCAFNAIGEGLRDAFEIRERR
ncbi:MAG TPA: ABC transporter permease [Cellulomonas sp.]